MYPSSGAYKTAIAAPGRSTRITGVLTLSGGSTVNLTEADLVQGSLVLSEQCVSGDNFEIGNVYASELCVSLLTPTSSPWSLAGAKLALSFGIDVSLTSTPSWEDIPLGVFWVTEIDRKTNFTFVRALDGMILLDAALGATNVTARTIEQLVTSACATAGVTLATTHTTFETYPNKAMTLTLPTGSEVKTCRDLIMWACQINGTFARMNRAGQLEILLLHSSSVRTITQTERFSPTTVSDSSIQVTGLQEPVQGTVYTQGTTTMMLVLDENPLLKSQTASAINAALTALLADVTQAVYTPFDADFIGDPTLQAGDYVTLSSTGALGSNPVGLITHNTWRYRDRHTLSSVGKPGIVKTSTDQTGKKLTSLSMDLINAGRIITGKLQSVDGTTYFDLNTPEIKQTATVGGKAVVVTVSPTKPFELSINGIKEIYVSTAGVLVTSRYDVNEDGMVDQTDVDLIQTYLQYGTGYLPRMDVNGSGTVTLTDFVQVKAAANAADSWPASRVASTQAVLRQVGQDTGDADYQLIEEDFLNVYLAGGQMSMPFPGIAVSGGIISSTLAHIANHPGVVVFRGSGTSGGGAYISSVMPYCINGSEIFECVFLVNSLANATIRLGMHDSVSGADAVDGIYLEIASTGVATGKSAANSSRTATGTTVTLSANTWYRLRIEMNSTAAIATYYIYDAAGTELWTDYVDANLPTGAGREVTCVKLTATKANTSSQDVLSIDWVKFLQRKVMTR